MTVCANIASAHSSQLFTPQGCRHPIVYLHDTSPTTSKCMDTPQRSPHGSSATMIPYTNVTNCGPQSLHLFNNINFDASNGDVCFVGTGFINLTDIQGPWWWGPFVSWNDKASSYQTNCTQGTFYADINGNGSHQAFASRQSANFDGVDFKLNNDTLSSFDITSQC